MVGPNLAELSIDSRLVRYRSISWSSNDYEYLIILACICTAYCQEQNSISELTQTRQLGDLAEVIVHT